VGRTQLLAGGLAEAAAAGQCALEIARAIDDVGYELEALILLGRTAQVQGSGANADFFRAALDLARPLFWRRRTKTCRRRPPVSPTGACAIRF
jgi:hypothetical protein